MPDHGQLAAGDLAGRPLEQAQPLEGIEVVSPKLGLGLRGIHLDSQNQECDQDPKPRFQPRQR